MSFLRLQVGARVLTLAVGAAASVPVDSGWTDFTESADTRKVYVSSTGNDSNDGLTTSTPKLTIAAGYALLRNGYPDWLLFKRGDTWTGETLDWKKCGRSASEKMLVSSYGSGTARPQFNTGAASFITVTGGGGAPATIDYVAFVGLSATPHTRPDSTTIYGFRWIQDGSYLLIEDCKFDSYTYNLDIEPSTSSPGAIAHVTIRRSVICDAYTSGAAHAQGLFCKYIDYLVIEENLFDHNGWKVTVGENPDVFKHNIYIGTQNGQGVKAPIVRYNYLTNGSSHGVQARSGGFIYGNIVVRNAIGILLGGGTVDAQTHTSGVSGSVYSNVVLEGKDIDGSNLRGQGIEIANIGPDGASVYSNIVANKYTTNVSGVASALTFSADSAEAGVGVNNSHAYDNIFYNWGKGFAISTVTTPTAPTTAVAVSGNQFTDNDIQDPTFASPGALAAIKVATGQVTYSGTRMNTSLASSAWTTINGVNKSVAEWNTATSDTATAVAVSYAAPTRSLATYYGSLGFTATNDAFLAACRLQSRYEWVAALAPTTVLAYLQAGFVN